MCRIHNQQKYKSRRRILQKMSEMDVLIQNQYDQYEPVLNDEELGPPHEEQNEQTPEWARAAIIIFLIALSMALLAGGIGAFTLLHKR